MITLLLVLLVVAVQLDISAPRYVHAPAMMRAILVVLIVVLLMRLLGIL